MMVRYQISRVTIRFHDKSGTREGTIAEFDLN
jgi:hypothetical protein